MGEIIRQSKIILLLLFSSLLLYFVFRPGIQKLKRDLDFKNPATTIIQAAFKLGERKDVSAVKPLLANILDPRMCTNINFKGMTVCYCRLGALQKISNLKPPIKLDQFEVDTIAAQFYLNWALKKGLIKSKEEINLNYYR